MTIHSHLRFALITHIHATPPLLDICSWRYTSSSSTHQSLDATFWYILLLVLCIIIAIHFVMQQWISSCDLLWCVTLRQGKGDSELETGGTLPSRSRGRLSVRVSCHSRALCFLRYPANTYRLPAVFDVLTTPLSLVILSICY